MRKGQTEHYFEEALDVSQLPQGTGPAQYPKLKGSGPMARRLAKKAVEVRLSQMSPGIKETLEQLREEAAATAPRKVLKKHRPGGSRGRWRDIPQGPEDLYDPEPLTDRQYFAVYLRQQQRARKRQREWERVRSNPFFLG